MGACLRKTDVIERIKTDTDENFLFIKPLKQLRYETCCNLNFIIPAIKVDEKEITPIKDIKKRRTIDFEG
jgi:hypothetical protein